MDCTNCEKKKAAVPELTSEERTFLLAMESKDARYQKLIRWIVTAFIVCMLLMSAIFFWAWTSYEYVGEDIEVDGGENGIANYIGDKGVIFNNGENYGSAEVPD